MVYTITRMATNQALLVLRYHFYGFNVNFFLMLRKKDQIFGHLKRRPRIISKLKKYQRELPQLPASRDSNFKGECDPSMLHGGAQPTQHVNSIFHIKSIHL